MSNVILFVILSVVVLIFNYNFLFYLPFCLPVLPRQFFMFFYIIYFPLSYFSFIFVEKLFYMVYIIRNSKLFGPYSNDTLCQMVKDGKILNCDSLCFEPDVNSKCQSVGSYLKSIDSQVSPTHYSSVGQQLSMIGSDLLFPKGILKKDFWTADNKMIPLAFLGLTPLALSFLPFRGFVSFYALSLYFSILWGVCFYYFFKSSQVVMKYAVRIFLCTQLLLLVIWGLNLNNLNPFYAAINPNSSSLTTFAGFVLGVGLTEEFVKAIPLLVILHFTSRPLVPRTLVFYGLISGVAFGVYEGVSYQINVNSHLNYSDAYFSNILRLTSLPFFHAVLTAIAGFFLSFANIYPKFRRSLYLLAFSIPVVLHGSYDFFVSTGHSLISLCVCLLSVALLTYYLRKCNQLQSRVSGF